MSMSMLCYYFIVCNQYELWYLLSNSSKEQIELTFVIYICKVCNFCETSSTIIMTVFRQVSSPHLLLVSKTDSPASKHKRLIEPMLLCNDLIMPHFNFKSNKTETSVKSPEIWKSNKSFLFALLTGIFEHFLPFLSDRISTTPLF